MNREVEKLAIIERLINEVKTHGYGGIEIKIKDGHITHVRPYMDHHWSNDLTVEVPLVIIEKT